MQRIAVLLLLSFAEACAATAPTMSAPCVENRDALLALEPDAFDQDINGGWRMVAKRDECRLPAADLIKSYRRMHEAELSGGKASNLRWHEAQLRASMGQTQAALALFETTYSGRPDWDAYVAATIAFLRGDRDNLVAARDQLAKVPPPSNFDQMALEYERRTGRRIRWPANLDVVDGLIRCFGKSYREAYATEACRAFK